MMILIYSPTGAKLGDLARKEGGAEEWKAYPLSFYAISINVFIVVMFVRI